MKIAIIECITGNHPVSKKLFAIKPFATKTTETGNPIIIKGTYIM
nr:hypothetical protein [uncultured Carboxylicivirga sp.]